MEFHTTRWAVSLSIAAPFLVAFSFVAFSTALNAQCGLDLGDIAGGGDGLGDKLEEVLGIHPDTGEFMTEYRAEEISDLDGVNPAPVTESDFVDSVFILNETSMEINTTGVTFEFKLEDSFPSSYNLILSNATHDMLEVGQGEITVGNETGFASAVAMHAAAGITFDLEAMRADYGAKNVKILQGTVGTGCGSVTLYIIYSDENEVLEDHTWTQTLPANQGFIYEAAIPAEAKFLTFATGQNNNGLACTHGIFADTVILPDLPEARIAADPEGGPAPLAVQFDGSGSTTPEGTIESYEWDLGDGETGTGPQVAHTFQAADLYSVTLTVTDSRGCSSTAHKDLIVLFPSGDVTPWSSVTVGDRPLPGGARFTAGCLQLFATGDDIASRADEFHFVYQTRVGDASIKASLKDVKWDLRSRVGVMFRQSVEPDSPFAFVGLRNLFTGSKANFVSRDTKGERGRSRSLSLALSPPSAFLRLDRRGQEFKAFGSADGQNWTELRSATIADAPDEMLLGLAAVAVDSRGAGVSVEATFCNVELTGAAPASGDFRRGDVDDNGVVNVTDAVAILNFLFSATNEPSCKETADVNDDGQVNLTDGVNLLNFLFGGTAPPPDPGPDSCGPDAADSENAGCVSYRSC